MSYDEQGNFQIDITDSEDVEGLDNARQRREFDKIVQQEEKAAESAQFQQNFASASWQEALADSNLTQEQYNEICSQHPEAATKMIKDSPKSVVRGIASLKGKAPQQRDPRGQYIPQAPAPAQRQVAQGASVAENLEKAQAKARKSGLSYEDELNVIDTLFEPPTR